MTAGCSRTPEVEKTNKEKKKASAAKF